MVNELRQVANIITDGCTRLPDNIIIITVSRYCSLPQKAIWLGRGTSLRKSHPERKWVVYIMCRLPFELRRWTKKLRRSGCLRHIDLTNSFQVIFTICPPSTPIVVDITSAYH